MILVPHWCEAPCVSVPVPTIASATLRRSLPFQHVCPCSQCQVYRRHAALCLDLFNRIVGHADLSDDQMFGLAVNMWREAQKHGQLDTKMMVSSVPFGRHAFVLKMNTYLPWARQKQDDVQSCLSSKTTTKHFARAEAQNVKV